MASLKQKVERLERAVGSADGPRFLVVMVQPDEDRERALERTLQEDGPDRSQVGRVLFFDRVSKELETVDLLPNLDASIADEREFWSDLYNAIRDSGDQRTSTIIAAEAALKA